MIQRYTPTFFNMKFFMDDTDDGDYVLCSDHLEELDHALKDAAGEIAGLTAERDNWKATAGHEADGLESWKNEATRLRVENERLAAYKKDVEDSYERIMNEECSPDEMHCTCVPLLRNKITDLENQRNSLTAEVARLADWKASSMEVENSWDVQAVGKEIGVGLGLAIRPQILPHIKALTAEVARLHSELAASKKFADDCIDQLIREQEESAPLYESLVPLWEVYEKWESVHESSLEQVNDYLSESWDALKGFWDVWHIK
jgi:uncharacterized small protein (DUF1192 family)